MRLVFVIVVGLFVNKVIVQCVCVCVGDRPLSLNPLFLGPLVWLAFLSTSHLLLVLARPSTQPAGSTSALRDLPHQVHS